MSGSGLRVLVVDDEAPAVEEVSYLLRQDSHVAEVLTALSSDEALRILDRQWVDALLLDIAMPGLSGFDLARVLAHFSRPPQIIFVTAHEHYAVEAFELRALDYVLKPVRADRMAAAVRRVVEALPEPPHRRPDDDERIAVELGGVIRFIYRREIQYVEAQGDYARLHTAHDSHLIRVPLSQLETEWADAGFVRIHRSLLVATAHISQVRMEAGRCAVIVGNHALQVARRHRREFREKIRLVS